MFMWLGCCGMNVLLCAVFCIFDICTLICIEGVRMCFYMFLEGIRRFGPIPMAARLLGFWVQIPPGVWMSVCCERCVLSGRGLCVGLITRPEESYRLWCVCVCMCDCGHKPSTMRRPWFTRAVPPC
jgi:hypothetical protein